MLKVSINLLTKNRALAVSRALLSVAAQNYGDYEITVIDDGSADDTPAVLKNFKINQAANLKIITHDSSWGITKSRQISFRQKLYRRLRVMAEIREAGQALEFAGNYGKLQVEPARDYPIQESTADKVYIGLNKRE
jgi:glycosyltransferase involved in cell wall biosynthesis